MPSTLPDPTRARRSQALVVTRFRVGNTQHTPDPTGLFSEGGEVIKLHIEGSLTIPKPGTCIIRILIGEC